MTTFQENLELWAKTCPKQAVMLPYADCKGLTLCRTQLGEPNLQRKEGPLHYFYHSQTGAAKEAKLWFHSLPLRKVLLLCVYGVGLGYYYDAAVEWLQKDRKRGLVFLENDPAVIYKLLQTTRGTEILKNPQVQLLYFHDLNEKEIAFEQLYWNFALTRIEITALQSYEQQKKELYDEIKYKITYDAATKNALVDEYMDYGANFYLNFYKNILHLGESYLGTHFVGKCQKIPAIICGAGPSLAQHLPIFQQLLDKAIIFAGGSAMNALNAAGFQPHFGAAIDPNAAQAQRMSTNQAYEVPFFYRNRLFYKALKMIEGPRLYITGAGGYDTAEFFEEKLNIRHDQFVDEGHNVINFCVDVAHSMGCDPIIFLGMDLAFTGSQEYAPGVKEVVAGNSQILPKVPEQEGKPLLKTDIYGNPIYTLWKWIAESNWIGNFAKEHPSLTIINCTEGGLGFPNIPNKPLKKIIEKYLSRQYELPNFIHGEIQNSTMRRVTRSKIVAIMKSLSASLQRCNKYLQQLIEDTEMTILKIKKGKNDPLQSGKAALAETELAEEPAYKYVLGIFNEVYSHLMSGDLHIISTNQYSEGQRKQKRLKLLKKKYDFLRNTAKINAELITHALRTDKTIIRGTQKRIKSTIAISSAIYRFDNHRLFLSDPDLNLFIDEPFDPVLVPSQKKEGAQLAKNHSLRLSYNQDSASTIRECYVMHQGMLSGQCLLLYPDGSVKTECFYKNNRLHGPATFWSKSGKILAKSWFINGLQEGKSYWYYPSGKLYSIQQYKQGVRHGKQEFFLPNGTLKTQLFYPF